MLNFQGTPEEEDVQYGDRVGDEDVQDRKFVGDSAEARRQ